MSKILKLPTLLVVTDRPTVRFWIKKHLDDRFFILMAGRRSEAIGALSSRLDFIIVDSTFEDCDPLDLCKELRSQAKLVPIFLITGRLKKSFRERAYQSGVTEFLGDELDVSELEVRIEAGQKAASVREKTTDLAISIRNLPETSARSLKSKLILNEKNLKFLKDQGSPLAVLLIQIDRFQILELKEEISESLAEFIKNLLREKDRLIPCAEGRILLLLHNTSLDAAKKVAQRLKDRISSHVFSAIRKITVSIVVSLFQGSEKKFQNLVDAAQKLLETQSETNLVITTEEDTA